MYPLQQKAVPIELGTWQKRIEDNVAGVPTNLGDCWSISRCLEL
jgi:hypothetical protein